LANILVAGFEPFQNAPKEVLDEHRPGTKQRTGWGGNEGKFTALEIAIISESKSFLSASACQKVIGAVYLGRIVYSPISYADIIPDQ